MTEINEQKRLEQEQIKLDKEQIEVDKRKLELDEENLEIDEERLDLDDEHHEHRNEINLIFIVNGVDAPIEAKLNQPLKVARDKALVESNNTGRPMDEWEVHNDEGQALDADKKVEELGLVDGARLFLNLKVGAGGA